MLFLALLHPASALSEEEFNKVVDAVSSVGVEVDTKAYGNIGSIINGHYKYTGPIAYAGITADVSIKIQDYTEIMKIYGYKNYKEIPASGSNILRSDLNREKARCDEYQSGSDDIFKQISTIEVQDSTAITYLSIGRTSMDKNTGRDHPGMLFLNFSQSHQELKWQL